MEMCGLSMPDVLNVDFNSATSAHTHFRITEYALTPKTTVAKTLVHIHFRISMGSGSGLGTGNDLVFGRKLIGTINGHSIGEYIFKHHNVVAEAWSYGEVSNYTFDCEIPYSPGVVYCNLKVVPEGPGSATYMTTSTFNTGTNAYTMVSQAGIIPASPTNILINTASAITVAYLTGTAALTWTKATDGTGGVKSHDIYYSYGAGWIYLGNTANMSTYTLDLTRFVAARGAYVRLGVRSVGLYGNSVVTGDSRVWLASLPVLPTSFVSPENAQYYLEELTYTWSGATAGSGTITGYRIKITCTTEACVTTTHEVVLGVVDTYTLDLGATTLFTPGIGDIITVQVRPINSYDLESAAYTTGILITLQGGIMKARNSTGIHSGLAHIKVAGIWKKAKKVFIKAADTWEESVV